MSNDPFQLSSVWLPPEYLDEIKQQFSQEVENATQEDLVEALTDVHTAIAKMSFVARTAPDPVGEVIMTTLASVTRESMRLSAERYVFREVLTIPNRE